MKATESITRVRDIPTLPLTEQAMYTQAMTSLTERRVALYRILLRGTSYTDAGAQMGYTGQRARQVEQRIMDILHTLILRAQCATNEGLDTRIHALPLGTRASKLCAHYQVRTIRDLLDQNPLTLLSTRDYGRGTLQEIENALMSFKAACDISASTAIAEWIGDGLVNQALSGTQGLATSEPASAVRRLSTA